MQYGINIFLQSQDATVSEFRCTAVVKNSGGQVGIFTTTAARQDKASGVQYSTLCSMWVDTMPGFEVLAIQIKTVSSSTSTNPTAGVEYSNTTRPD